MSTKRAAKLMRRAKRKEKRGEADLKRHFKLGRFLAAENELSSKMALTEEGRRMFALPEKECYRALRELERSL